MQNRETTAGYGDKCRCGVFPDIFCALWTNMACCAINCTNRPSKKFLVQFFRLPLGDADRLDQWMSNIRRQNWTPNQSSRLCSEHFESHHLSTDSRGRTCLKDTAVPTIFSFSNVKNHLPREKAQISDNDKFQARMVKRRITSGAEMPEKRILQPDDGRGLSLVPPTPAASTSELEQTQDSKDLMLPSDVQQMVVIKEEVSWIPSLDQQDPQSLYLKEEEEELWTSQEREQLHEEDKSDPNRFSFTVVTVKGEDDEEQPELHQIKTETNRETEPPANRSDTQMKTETGGEDRGGPGRIPNNYSQPNINENSSDSFKTEASDDDDALTKYSDSGPETEDSDSIWKQTEIPEPGVSQDGGCNPGKEKFSCSECGKQFLYKLSFKKHARVHSQEKPQKPFGCHDCGKRFNKKSHFQSHMRIHTGEKPFGCRDCGKSFNERGTLSKHTRIHTGEKPFTCNDCGKQFREKGALSIHMRVHTGEKPFACPSCGKRFRDQGTLCKHMKVHTGEKPFACYDCDKRFSERTTLLKHMRVHTGEKPFACSDCGKSFSERGSLKLHMRMHTGEKPFGCTDCLRRFSRSSHLKMHIRRVHTGEKPFGCTDCSKRFSERGSLSKHIRVHTGEKPFPCSYCGKRFNYKSHLNVHIRRVHTGEKPFGCDDCDKRFSERGNLSRHVRVHSRENQKCNSQHI
ncbi:endothelial zinc finger protein induced by tumor necrosis factor alpha-like isoform X6 [Melanotaenia boesemani]|uniref:endothelial zinc finger protein induced by tumor necrosis factor alpha-like isoform X6 n=1 Tax=Melanotaenia boesemani TaxID=1250792 RepID=UPI001C05AF4B|nr:endothelial zinc finger protein induced by tumor necrosis factor alpha-like isoform X6 [Melanotaenia boesemani]